MSRFHVDAAAVAALGVEMVALADQLAAQPESANADVWAFGEGESGEAFADLMEHWRRARLELARSLSDLGESAKVAGGLYLDTETMVGNQLLVGGVQ